MKKILLSIFLLLSLLTIANDTVNVRFITPIDSSELFMKQFSPYVLKVEANNTAETDSIWSVYFTIDDNQELHASKVGNYYMTIFEPSAYRMHKIKVRAISSSGAEKVDSIYTHVKYEPFVDKTIRAFDTAVIAFGSTGQWARGTYEFPTHINAYDSLHARLYMTCPPGGCDPYDRWAWIEAKGPDGNWVEIIRYITPFNKACAHEIDLSDYIFMLQGEVDLRMYIETWAGEWQVTLDFEFYRGNNGPKYGSVDVLYNGNYPFGNYANLQPFDTYNHNYPEHTNTSHLNMMVSGHGWGDNNTGNAAEFRLSVHQLYVLGVDTFEQDTEYNCNPNPDGCSPQPGTWTFNRSGWCPGAISPPYQYDFTPFISNGNIDILYEFEKDYVDFCHPNHPDCVSGVTCPDCNDGFNPFYWVSANLMSYSNTEPFEMKNIAVGIEEVAHKIDYLKLYPNPTKDILNISFSSEREVQIMIYDAMGSLIDRIEAFDIDLKQQNYPYNVSNLSSGLYFVQLIAGREIEAAQFLVE